MQEVFYFKYLSQIFGLQNVDRGQFMNQVSNEIISAFSLE